MSSNNRVKVGSGACFATRWDLYLHGAKHSDEKVAGRQLGGSAGVALCALAVDRLGDAGLPATFAALSLAAPLALVPMAVARRERRFAAPQAGAA
ncbi:MAG: hypothetical protein E6J62_15065 [Deltaproteobacteria bacterium]|nr:MAG: hypothetical protein E6J85_01295 [Deltaproteobacteria bacterium]TMB29839.1 MAG: hypothetical protein E6J61_14270 [Deltaproteobacteria bacterium]TMB30303.1 MAG: hypothetical protein E6J62_15065 [Deltaproteobacteria bacterium]